MANTKSAIKAARKSARLTTRNKAVKTRLKTLHKKLLTADRTRVMKERGAKFAEANAKALQTAHEEATYAWDASPISTGRLMAEIWAQIRNENWALVSRDSSPSNWPHRLWTFDQHHQFIGGPGGAGIGYGLPAAVGASFAHRSIDSSRLP